MRRDERGAVQGPVKEQQPDGMSHRGGGGRVLGDARRQAYERSQATRGRGYAGSGRVWAVDRIRLDHRWAGAGRRMADGRAAHGLCTGRGRAADGRWMGLCRGVVRRRYSAQRIGSGGSAPVARPRPNHWPRGCARRYCGRVPPGGCASAKGCGTRVWTCTWAQRSEAHGRRLQWTRC